MVRHAVVGRSRSDGSPDPAVVRRDRQTDLLEGDDRFQVELATMQFLDIVAADRKPEGHLPFAISEVQGHETVLWPANRANSSTPSR